MVSWLSVRRRQQDIVDAVGLDDEVDEVKGCHLRIGHWKGVVLVTVYISCCCFRLGDEPSLPS